MMTSDRNDRTRKGRRPALPAGLFVLVALLVPAIAAAAGLSGLSYALTPGVDWVQWDEKIGLEDDLLYGGRLSLNFGRYIALRGYYFGNSEVGTDFSSLDLGTGEDYSGIEPKMDIVLYGADVSFGLGSGPIVPYLYGGPGIVRFTPDGGGRSNQILLKAGAGLKLKVTSRVEGLFYFEDDMFRLNRSNLLPTEGDEEGKAVLAPVDDPGSDDIRHNYAFGAGLSFYLGGYDPSRETALDRAYRRQFAGGLSGASFKFQPYAGWLDYDNGFGFKDQQFAGARAGIGIGEMVDVLGFYWRGVDDDFSKTEQVQSWGGELDFNLNPGPGVSPRILVGAGSLDYMSGFSENGSAKPDDKVLFIAGAGLDFSLGRRLRAEVRVRDFMFSETDVSETSSPDEIFHNWVYSAGLTFGIGGGGADRERIDALGRERWGVKAPEPAAEPSPEGAPRKAMKRPWAPLQGEAPRRVEREILVKETGPTGEPKESQMASPVRTNQGDRVVTLPVPTTGEIYIRYGEPGAVTIESKTPPAPAAATTDSAASAAEMEAKVRTAIREGLEGEVPVEAPGAGEGAAADSLRMQKMLETFENRLIEKLDERIASQVESQVARRAAEATPAGPQTLIVTPGGAIESVASPVAYQRSLGYTGLNADEPEQMLFGARVDLGPVGKNPAVIFAPEVAIGLFNETSFLLAAHLRWDIGTTIRTKNVNPYVYGGPGLLIFSKKIDDRDKTEGAFDLGYGVSKAFGNRTFFLEHQGVDLFSLHRIIVGASLGF